jgi:SpoIIAA-like
MLSVTLNEDERIAILEPHGKLTEADFMAAAEKIDPYIETSGNLTGIIVYVKAFPVWDSFAALVEHLKFAHNHHKKVSRVAFVTDSPIGELAEHVANHFINAEIRHFSHAELNLAKEWISNTNSN